MDLRCDGALEHDLEEDLGRDGALEREADLLEGIRTRTAERMGTLYCTMTGRAEGGLAREEGRDEDLPMADRGVKGGVRKKSFGSWGFELTVGMS